MSDDGKPQNDKAEQDEQAHDLIEQPKLLEASTVVPPLSTSQSGSASLRMTSRTRGGTVMSGPGC